MNPKCTCGNQGGKGHFTTQWNKLTTESLPCTTLKNDTLCVLVYKELSHSVYKCRNLCIQSEKATSYTAQLTPMKVTNRWTWSRLPEAVSDFNGQNRFEFWSNQVLNKQPSKWQNGRPLGTAECSTIQFQDTVIYHK